MSDPRWTTLGRASSVNPRGRYVVYWCRAYRRAEDNLALDHAIARANALSLPLVCYEALDVRYPYASDRMHTFVLQGASEMAAAMAARNVAYAFHLPRTAAGARSSRAVERLASEAALVVTDAYPSVGDARNLWGRTAALAARLSCPLETYDDAAVVPFARFTKHEVAARTIRPKVHAVLEASLTVSDEPTVRAPAVREMVWPFEPTVVSRGVVSALVASCEIDHDVAPVRATPGGPSEARLRLERFVRSRLRTYDHERNDMARVATSGLSAHLHFGHISARAMVFAARAADVPPEARGAFLEELVVRRSLAFNHVLHEPAHATYASVPRWAREQLDAHASDPRLRAHTRDAWEGAETADPLWNAAQRELLRDGIIHPYARMLWGKVGLTLAARPEDAFDWLVYLNDKYALDGRDPNTYTNIGWCFGLHDHPYPSRPVFGTVRSMTSRSAAQKWDVREYLSRVGANDQDLTVLAAPRRAGAKPKVARGLFDEFDQRPPSDPEDE